MKESIITAVLAVVSFIMVAVAAVGILTSDKKAPVISLEGKNNLTYTEGDEYDILLENMTAEDERDGDVTDSLRVSKIYHTEANRAVVVYVAKDDANNIGKLKREIRYQEKEEPKVTEKEEVQEEKTQDETPAAQTQTQEPTVQQNTTEQTREPEQTVAANPTGKPQLTMILNEATLKVGETFNVLRYVQSAVDADGTSLNRYIHADGAYDMSQPGTYAIRVYATSPNGNTSNIETFTLTVEP